DFLNTGGRYNPTTDSWTPTSTANAPTGGTGVWTGTEMIVWGDRSNTGGRYNPTTDTWTPTSITNAPIVDFGHTAVWTGSEMIVWGGTRFDGEHFIFFNTGGRYNASTDTWTATGTTNAPAGGWFHTAIWTGSEMIVWGSRGTGVPSTGGRYNPGTDSWMATSTTNAPTSRGRHTAVWTGTEMIVWCRNAEGGFLNTGGRYNPTTDSWTPTSTANAPTGGTAVWSGTVMIVWGGYVSSPFQVFNTGGRYNPTTNNWTATSITNAPEAREGHTAVWTGSEMIVWGGSDVTNALNTGGRYCGAEAPGRLGNISTRAFVQTGDNVEIGGFIVQGTEPKRV